MGDQFTGEVGPALNLSVSNGGEIKSDLSLFPLSLSSRIHSRGILEEDLMFLLVDIDYIEPYMALELNENMQGNPEASLKYLQYKGPHFDPHSNGDLTKGPSELDHVTCSHPGGDAALSDQSLSSNSHEIPNKCQKKTDYKHGYSSIPAFHFNSMYQCQMNMFEGQFYPFPMENYFQYVPFGISAQIYSNEFQRQDFQYFVVIDFEATCNKDKNPHPQEIIEFPSVIVGGATGQLEACFQTYVRPTCNQILSEFCKDLTGIQQIQVDRGITLSEALLRHDKWLEKKGIKNTDFAVVTWSDWDCKVMLESECQFKKIRKPSYFNRWINLKVPFHEVFGGLRCNLKEAVEMAGLVWQGRAHCGLDDAKNTARLLALLMQRGFKFSITNSMCQTSNNPCAWKQYPDPMIVSAKSTQNPKDMHVPNFYYHPYCFCGVMSSKGIVDNAGPKQGCIFFGCGNWTLSRGACCHYFEWASS